MAGDPPPKDSADTDPAVADTQASDPGVDATAAKTAKRRAVRAGDVLGRYELVDDIGEGGMASVYRARDRELRRDVAVKVLFPHLARRPELVQRFHREARAAAGLEHANILRIYDVGPDAAGEAANDPPYIVMELIRGRTLLAEIEQRGPMLAEVVACIGALLADALAAAHRAGIIHRDVKPANVLIAPGGRLLLADFGVARLETEDSLVTRTGALLGTPAYMSPEQASGDTATAKSDIYSLGATLYQLATGSLPYTGTPAKVMSQIATGSLVAPLRRRAAVGPDLSRAIERMMEAEPAKRSASAVEVASELRAIASAGGLGEPTDELAAYFADPDAFVTARTPTIVSALVASAQRAVADAKLPRAMALADRASALAPDDPAVAALVHTVTAGGRALRWRRFAALGGIAIAGAAAVTYAVIAQLGERPHAAHASDAAAPIADARVLAPPVDAPIVPPDAELVTPAAIDAAAPRVRPDARPESRRLDAAALTDAAIDGPPVLATPSDAAAPGAIVVVNDTWCEVTIDGANRGRLSAAAIRVDAGKHVVRCEQPGMGGAWMQEVEVAPGKTVTVSGSLLGFVDVTFAIDAKLDGVAHARAAVAKIKAGRHEVTAAGVHKFIDVRVACTIRPDLECYP